MDTELNLRICNFCSKLYWKDSSFNRFICTSCDNEYGSGNKSIPISNTDSIESRKKSKINQNSREGNWLIFDEVENDFEDRKCMYCKYLLADLVDCIEWENHIRACMSRIVSHSGIEDEIFPCVLCGRDLSNSRLAERFTHLGRCAKAHGISLDHLLQILHPELGHERDVTEIPMTDTLNSSSTGPLSATKDKNGNRKNGPWPIIMPAVGIPSSISKDNKVSSGNGRTWSTSTRGGKPPSFKLINGTGLKEPIMVDGFQYADSNLTRTYFLTHFHSDHYGGITKKFSAGQIYCSEATAGLLQMHFGLAAHLITALSFESTHRVSCPGGGDFDVVLLDANHCPGAACLLFTFSDGRQVLHTGDFRWNSCLLTNSPGWARLADQARALADGQISACAVYLDTTYCDPKHTFPSQDLAVSAAARMWA